MFTALLIVQVLLGLSIIGLVLLQQGKGADMGAAFGAGASGTVFGSRGGGSFFTRMTAILAALFFINSIVLSSPLVRQVHDPDSSVTRSVPLEAPAEDVPPMEEAVEGIDLPPADMPPMDLPATDAGASDLPPVEPADAAAAPEPDAAAGE